MDVILKLGATTKSNHGAIYSSMIKSIQANQVQCIAYKGNGWVTGLFSGCSLSYPSYLTSVFIHN